MIRAAGILYVANGTALFLKRGADSDFPGAWCLPGGGIDGNETAEQAARREFEEETGRTIGATDLKLWTRRIKADAPPPAPSAAIELPQPIDFTTFIVAAGEPFEPVINGEHVGFAWAPIDSPPEPLHPGCRVTLARLMMDELGVARAMSEGELTSPQRYENMWLFDLRITGTGTAYRRKLDEFVYRRPENYLTPEFLARCNGLAVILMHPDKAMLNHQEFEDRVIGAILLPYIKGEEVWGVAKIYDQDAALMMSTKPLSTSPAVFFRDLSVNSKMHLEDGSTLLIEGKPSLLDHLAICEHGVWDKGEGPTGVRADDISQAHIRKDSNMTPEEKAKADAEAAAKKADEDKEKAKADADAGQKLDKLLAGIDALTAKCDSIGSRMDSFEAKDKERADAEEAEEKKKADAEEKARKDAMSPEQLAADKARKDNEDKEKKDNEEKEKAKADADARAKADSEQREADRKRLDAVEKLMPKALSDADYTLMADCQARADSVFQAFGEHAPRPLQGEDINGYRRRLTTKLKVHSDRWKDIDVGAIADDNAFTKIEDMVYADATHTASNPRDLQPGQIRPITRTDPITGMRSTTFVGNGTFIGQMRGPRRYVTNFKTQSDARH